MHCLMKAWHDNEYAIKSWLIKQTGNQDQAQDLLQDIFIKALQHKQVFCRIEDAKSWLFKIAHNCFIDSYRKSKLRITVPELEVEDKTQGDSQDNATLMTDLQHCMTRVILELDEDDQEIIELCDIQGMKQTKYAQLKQLSLTATKSRIQRARKRLRRRMVSACQVKFEHNKVCSFTLRK
ncbi:sigma-70 family RNA polymerase sigma factor [Psychromonas sp. SR45-3]|uniref:sigma-70 family RNA polymerase sigma factor n=1 Tax=Psychromonas sp. SR45-3 TaxID=2760930 RepID=UPI0015FC0CD3|nr:sigma-70 family RNA polymerase sigma factor [Psychromonas sp. SR45-3]MBB1273854.1 sigma-70 family RNA polymerase sigma factor [Psychromonas sp. SR45-3]